LKHLRNVCFDITNHVDAVVVIAWNHELELQVVYPQTVLQGLLRLTRDVDLCPYDFLKRLQYLGFEHGFDLSMLHACCLVQELLCQLLVDVPDVCTLQSAQVLRKLFIVEIV
jgi:hypothetical protein